nr:MAG TPA: hypothetical protein [Bacteriophage sp.]
MFIELRKLGLSRTQPIQKNFFLRYFYFLCLVSFC